MNQDEEKFEQQEHPELGHIVSYGDSRIRSGDAPISKWLKTMYYILPFWGLLWFWLFWNGSHGPLDPGYWQQLQRAANTTFPTLNQDNPFTKR